MNKVPVKLKLATGTCQSFHIPLSLRTASPPPTSPGSGTKEVRVVT